MKLQAAPGGEEKNRRFGNYVLGNLIRKGRVIDLQAAFHVTTHEEVLAKLVEKHSLSNSRLVTRGFTEFEEQSFVLTALNHRNILRLFEVVDTPTTIMLYTECLRKGLSLQSYVQRKLRIDEREALRIFSQMLSALDYCHRMKLLHRDLKLETIFIKGGEVKIGDISVAERFRFHENVITDLAAANYFAPELTKGYHNVSTACDIWDLGVILFGLVSGFLPFDSSSIHEVIGHALELKYVFPDYLSSECCHFLRALLAKEPLDRIEIASMRSTYWFRQSDNPPLLKIIEGFASITQRQLDQAKARHVKFQTQQSIDQAKSVIDEEFHRFNQARSPALMSLPAPPPSASENDLEPVQLSRALSRAAAAADKDSNVPGYLRPLARQQTMSRQTRIDLQHSIPPSQALANGVNRIRSGYPTEVNGEGGGSPPNATDGGSPPKVVTFFQSSPASIATSLPVAAPDHSSAATPFLLTLSRDESRSLAALATLPPVTLADGGSGDRVSVPSRCGSAAVQLSTPRRLSSPQFLAPLCTLAASAPNCLQEAERDGDVNNPLQNVVRPAVSISVAADDNGGEGGGQGAGSAAVTEAIETALAPALSTDTTALSSPPALTRLTIKRVSSSPTALRVPARSPSAVSPKSPLTSNSPLFSFSGGGERRFGDLSLLSPGASFNKTKSNVRKDAKDAVETEDLALIMDLVSPPPVAQSSHPRKLLKSSSATLSPLSPVQSSRWSHPVSLAATSSPAQRSSLPGLTNTTSRIGSKSISLAQLERVVAKLLS